MTTTPVVVPSPNTSLAVEDASISANRAASVSGAPVLNCAALASPLMMCRAHKNTAVTTRLFNTGAAVGAPKRRRALSNAVPMVMHPYTATWGANIRSNVVPTRCFTAV